MKHGDKTKGKASKASGKKASATGKSSKAPASAQAKSGAAKASTKASKPQTGNGGAATAARARVSAPDGGFTNPVVGAAFKLAVKKYPNTLRKLTD